MSPLVVPTSTDSNIDSLHQHIRMIAKELEEKTITLRRHLHKIPELGWEETKTLAFIKKEIQSVSEKSHFPIHIVEKKGGIWVDIDVDPSYDRILFRADIDALPITEETHLPFSSTHPGKMHACGHDCHAAMLLSAFHAIAFGMIRPKVNIRWVWQRAEEVTNTISGGKSLVQEGVCSNITKVFALHISSTTDAGVFYSRPNCFLGNSSSIYFTIDCLGGHVMHPNNGGNAIYIASEIHNALKGFEATVLGPNEPIAFVPCISQAGAVANIMPSKAHLCYAIRNFLTPELRDHFVSRIKGKILALVKSYFDANLSNWIFKTGFPVLHNDPILFEAVSHLLTEAGYSSRVSNLIFAGDDFVYYCEKIPGSYWTLGARQNEGWDHHTSKFNPSESVLWQGVAFWLELSQGI